MRSKQNKYLMQCMYLNQTSMGIYLLLIGAVLPMIRAEYGLSYKLSGIMMGVQSAGYFLAGLAAPLLPRLFGIKKTYLILANLALIGLGLIILTGNPFILLFAMLLTGISKGSCGNYNNSIVSNLSGNDASRLNFLQACFAIGDVGDLLERYPMSMGMLIVIPGLISTLMPSLIGTLADLWDIRRGMMCIFALIILLLAVTLADLKMHKSL